MEYMNDEELVANQTMYNEYWGQAVTGLTGFVIRGSTLSIFFLGGSILSGQVREEYLIITKLLLIFFWISLMFYFISLFLLEAMTGKKRRLISNALLTSSKITIPQLSKEGSHEGRKMKIWSKLADHIFTISMIGLLFIFVYHTN